MLSSSAFNALLKTIEEPPPYIVFIFATTEMQKVPATIKSRCQQFAFRLIPIETIQEILKNICAEMKIEAEDEALFWIARESTGSLRDAFTLFDQVASFSAGHISAQLIREKLGLVGLEKLNSLAEACAANDTPQCFALIDEILGSGVAIEQFIIDLAGFYRSLLLLKNGVTRESLLGYKPERFSAEVLESLDSIRLEQALELLLDCYRNIRYSVSPRFELETAVSKLSWLSRWISPPELRAAVDAARNALGVSTQDGLDRPLAGGPPSGPRESFANTPPFGAAQSGASQTGEATDRSVADTKARFGTASQGSTASSDSTGSAAPLGGGPSSLTEEFRRRMAARASGAAAADTAGGSAGPAAAEPFSGADRLEPAAADGDGATGDDEDLPVWRTLPKTVEQDKGASVEPEPPPDPRTERVLRLFRGTIVK
ncbi:hypothetical protein AGMMS50268_22510 [Spirochaetia bacterium]|nr:hypothetical protein AGMMS50268_22510 [Spirochaetia bacterium]